MNNNMYQQQSLALSTKDGCFSLLVLECISRRIRRLWTLHPVYELKPVVGRGKYLSEQNN